MNMNIHKVMLIKMRVLPHVFVPQKEFDGVDDGRGPQLNHDPLLRIVVNWMTCEATIQVIIM